MNVEQWLAARTPRPPAPLAERIAVRLGDDLRADASRSGSACADAAVRVVHHLLGANCGERHNALDLLAADALITYAVESAAERAGSRAPEMETLVARLAAIVDEAHA